MSANPTTSVASPLLVPPVVGRVYVCDFGFAAFLVKHLIGNGQGTGSWEEINCGKTKRKPELNDRMKKT